MSQTQHVHRHWTTCWGLPFIPWKTLFQYLPLKFFSCRKGVNMNASPFSLLTFPFLFSRLCAVSGLSKLLPGLVWDHKCVTAAGFSCSLQRPEFQPNQLEHFSKCRKQIQPLCGPGTGSKFQYFYWLQFHIEKEGSLATSQQGRY